MVGEKISLTGMNRGRSGIIAEIQGGHNTVNRLAAMGVFPGKKINKISAMFWRGPVTIEVDRAKIAIGFEMAEKIFVEMD